MTRATRHVEVWHLRLVGPKDLEIQAILRPSVALEESDALGSCQASRVQSTIWSVTE